jgi:hypothetical protein
MLNGKTKFVIPNIPEKAVLLRFNVLFAYVYDAVSGGKGMMLLKIEPSKNQTIASIMKETFPAIKCFNNEKLHLINHHTVAYIHALVIDSISILFEETINARALDHERAMLDVYSSMTPDAFKSQLQAALTTYYVDIMGVHGASGCPKPKIIKRRFEDQLEDDAGTTPDEDAGGEAAAAQIAAAAAGGAAAAQDDGDGAAAAPAGGEAAAAPAGADDVAAPRSPPNKPAGKGGKKPRNG